MSSTYTVLCLSHEPAIVARDSGYNRPEQAEAAIRDGIADHEACDLIIGRYSAAFVEFGCPRSADLHESLRPGVLRCYHGGTQWIDRDWLLLLAAAYQSDDPAIHAAIKAGHHGCLPWERLRRLRLELDFTVKEQAGA